MENFKLLERVAYVSTEKGAPKLNSTGTIVGIDYVCKVALVKFDDFNAGHNGVSSVFSTVTLADGFSPSKKDRDMWWCNFSFIKSVDETPMPDLQSGDVVEGKFPHDPYNLNDLIEDARVVDCVPCFDKAIPNIARIYRRNKAGTAYSLIWARKEERA